MDCLYKKKKGVEKYTPVNTLIIEISYFRVKIFAQKISRLAAKKISRSADMKNFAGIKFRVSPHNCVSRELNFAEDPKNSDGDEGGSFKVT